jgi:hypothetical protein
MSLFFQPISLTIPTPIRLPSLIPKNMTGNPPTPPYSLSFSQLHILDRTPSTKKTLEPLENITVDWKATCSQPRISPKTGSGENLSHGQIQMRRPLPYNRSFFHITLATFYEDYMLPFLLRLSLVFSLPSPILVFLLKDIISLAKLNPVRQPPLGYGEDSTKG